MKKFDSSPTQEDTEQSSRPLLTRQQQQADPHSPSSLIKAVASDPNDVSVLIKDPYAPIVESVREIKDKYETRNLFSLLDVLIFQRKAPKKLIVLSV